MAINIIAAIGQNNELGKDNDLIWKIPNDLKFFRQKTMGHDVIMGRKTFESLPKTLDGRANIVLTKRQDIIPDAIVYNDIEKLIRRYDYRNGFVIGGASLYEQFLEYAINLYLTEIEATCEDADTFFPSFNKEEYDEMILDECHDNKLDINYKHVLYKRRRL